MEGDGGLGEHEQILVARGVQDQRAQGSLWLGTMVPRALGLPLLIASAIIIRGPVLDNSLTSVEAVAVLLIGAPRALILLSI